MQEDENLVFTTTSVVEDKKTIVYAVHDEDGDWQFFSHNDEEIDDDNAALVSFDQIVALDPSIAELKDMPVNTEAYRDAADSPWDIGPVEPDC